MSVKKIKAVIYCWLSCFFIFNFVDFIRYETWTTYEIDVSKWKYDEIMSSQGDWQVLSQSHRSHNCEQRFTYLSVNSATGSSSTRRQQASGCDSSGWSYQGRGTSAQDVWSGSTEMDKVACEEMAREERAFRSSTAVYCLRRNSIQGGGQKSKQLILSEYVTTKQIISVTNKINLCGRLPGRKFPSSWPPMLIQMYIILYITQPNQTIKPNQSNI